MQPSFAEISRQYPLREQLRCDGIVIKGKSFRCPFHDDETPSANLLDSQDGGHEIGYCHTCEIHFDTVEYISRRRRISRQEAVHILTGQPMKPQQAPLEPKPYAFAPIPPHMVPIPPGKPIKYLDKVDKELAATTPSYVHHYYDAKGDCQGLVIRIDRDGDKSVFQVRYDLNRNSLVGKGWSGNDQPPLYNARGLSEHPTLPVLLVEGEKVVDTLKPLMPDWVVVTWQGGAKKAKNRDFSALDGRDVTLWPDADKNPKGGDGGGVVAMRDALARFKPRAAWWIEPLEEWYDLVKGYDAADLLEARGRILEVEETIRELRTPVVHETRPAPSAPDPTSRHFIQDHLPPGVEVIPNKNGDGLKQCEQNLWIFLRYHPLLKGRYRFDEFEQKLLVDGVEMTEAMLRDEMVMLAGDHFRQQVTSDKLAPSIWAVAHENKFNPVGERLRALAPTWDGTPRYLLDYAGVPSTEWSQLVSRRWGIGLARRIMEPGCKHDGVLMLEGDEGMGKTTFLEMLAASIGPETYMTLSTLHLPNNEAMALQGKVIVDMSEMAAINKSEVAPFKSLTSQRHDNYRIPWGKRNHNFQRTFVFAGTTNQTAGYLVSMTGNRRVWPVKVVKWGDRAAFERDLPQIWAELAQRVIEKETSEMTGNEAALQRSEVATREAVHPWQRLIEEWIETHADWFSYENLWAQCLEVPKERRQGGASKTVGEIMQKLRYEQKQKWVEGRNLWGWRPILP